MNYSPATGDEVALALAGAYSPPPGDAVLLQIAPPCHLVPPGDAVPLALFGPYMPPAGDQVALALICDDQTPQPCHTIPSGDAVPLALAGAYTPPPGDQVVLAIDCDVPTPAPPPEPEPQPDPGFIFTGLTARFGAAWSPIATLRLERRARALYTARTPRRDAAPRITWETDARAMTIPTRITWQQVPQADTAPRVAWEPLAQPLSHHAARIRWQKVPQRDRDTRVAWGQPIPLQGEVVRVGWTNPPPKDAADAVAWGQPTPIVVPEARMVWLDSSARDSIDWRIPWDEAQPLKIQFGIEPLPPPPPPPPPPPCYEVPDGDLVPLAFDGAYQPPQGDRVALSLTCGDVRILIPRRSYVMNHSLSVLRLPDMAPVQVTAVNIAVDEGSWAWTARLSVRDRASFNRILPTAAGPAEVQITVDGHQWVMLIEDPSEDRSAGAITRFAATGRSRTALLASPYAPERSYTNTQALLAAQLADRELEFTGFALDWQGPTWSVPAGAWSYSSLTPMAALTRIAAACGCMVQSDQAADVVRVLPRYKALPWQWATETPDVQLPTGAVTAMAHRRVPGPKYHGVYISGETQGVLVQVKRTGTQGDPHAELIVDPLNTDTPPAIARGGGVIADAQDRTQQPLTLPLFPGAPGPILPGELVEVVDTVYGTWRARASSLQIDCAARNDALTVRQRVEVLQHHDDLA